MSALLLFDVRIDPVPVQSPWVGLVVLLLIIFVLAVGFTAGLVALLIWLRRRKQASPVR